MTMEEIVRGESQNVKFKVIEESIEKLCTDITKYRRQAGLPSREVTKCSLSTGSF